VSKTDRFLFWPGQVVATPGAIEAIHASGEPPFDFLMRHLTGDWGDLCDDDKRANDVAVVQGLRILSAYILETWVKIWMITEAVNEGDSREHLST
jgi:hypothetical protein